MGEFTFRVRISTRHSRGYSPVLKDSLMTKLGKPEKQTFRSRRTAISRGAVFKGFIDGPQANTMDARSTNVPPPISVISSVARESIGVVVRKPFINGVHRREDRMWNHITGEYMADHQMRWLVKKRAQYDIKMVLSGATVEFFASYGGKLMKSEDVSIEYA
ncbi:hypothetical protein PG999_012296 [Apiospora kogelbergensis]|uniref:Uncharacterized protein n=1 Tax=Apiospora kogelbergensis TaxID=1337665 RepID=A0AAW0QML2_9PEZI